MSQFSLDTLPPQAIAPQDRFSSTASVHPSLVAQAHQIKNSPSVLCAVMSLALHSEKNSTQKVYAIANEEKELDRTLHLLMDLQSALYQVDDQGEHPLPNNIRNTIEQLQKRGIDLWSQGKQTFSASDRQKLIDAITGEKQMLHSKIQRLVTVDLSRCQTQMNTIINIAQNVLWTNNKHIQNIQDRMRH